MRFARVCECLFGAWCVLNHDSRAVGHQLVLWRFHSTVHMSAHLWLVRVLNGGSVCLIAGTIPYPPGYPAPPSSTAAATAAAAAAATGASGSPRRGATGNAAAAAAVAAAGGQLPDLTRLAPSQLATLLSDEGEYKQLLKSVVANSQVAVIAGLTLPAWKAKHRFGMDLLACMQS